MARTAAETAKYTTFLRLPLSSALRTMPGTNQAGGYDAMTIVKEKNELKSMQDLNRLRLLSSVKFGQFGRVIMEPGDKAHGCQARADLSLLIFLAPPLCWPSL